MLVSLFSSIHFSSNLLIAVLLHPLVFALICQKKDTRVFNLFYVLITNDLFALGKITKQCLKSSISKSFVANLSKTMHSLINLKNDFVTRHNTFRYEIELRQDSSATHK